MRLGLLLHLQRLPPLLHLYLCWPCAAKVLRQVAPSLPGVHLLIYSAWQ